MITTATRRRWHGVALPHVDLRLLVGLALVAVAFAGSLSLWGRMRVTEPVLVAAREIPSGHVLTDADLAVAQARLEGSLATLAIDESARTSVTGMTATEPIHAGALIVRPALGHGPVLGPDQAAVTVPVDAKAVFGSLYRGDTVAVLATSDPGKPQSLTTTLLSRATVYDIGTDTTRVSIGGGAATAGGPIANVTLAIPQGQAERVTHALVNGTITLLLVAPASGGAVP